MKTLDDLRGDTQRLGELVSCYDIILESSEIHIITKKVEYSRTTRREKLLSLSEQLKSPKARTPTPC